MCFSEKSSFISAKHQEPKQHKAFHIEATVLKLSVLDAPTGLSCLLLHWKCPEERQIKNNLCLARSETLDSRWHILPPCSHTQFVHYTPFKVVVPSIPPHIAGALLILAQHLPCSRLLLPAHVTAEPCSKLGRKCFLLPTDLSLGAASTVWSVPSVLSIQR